MVHASLLGVRVLTSPRALERARKILATCTSSVLPYSCQHVTNLLSWAVNIALLPSAPVAKGSLLRAQPRPISFRPVPPQPELESGPQFLTEASQVEPYPKVYRFPSPISSFCFLVSSLRCSLTTFRINTCKSVSKQRTLSTFRINTYAKTGGRGYPQVDAWEMLLLFAAAGVDGGVPRPCRAGCAVGTQFLSQPGVLPLKRASPWFVSS